MYKSNRISLILILVVILINLIYCSNEKNNSSGSEVTLKIHAWEGYVREYENEFSQYLKNNKKKPIHLEVTNTTGLDSFRNAINNQGVHLVSPANDFAIILQRENLLKPVDIKRLSRFNQLNPLIINKKSTVVNGTLFAVPFNFGPFILAYNKDKLKKPDSYKILWEPQHKGRVTIPGKYPTINIYMTALMLGMPKTSLFNLNNSQLARIEKSLRFLCKNQVSDFWDENLNPEKKDNFDLGMDWGIGVNKINRDYNGNWGISIPDEGVTGWVDTWAISINAKDEETISAAYTFIDFMLSPEIQAKMAQVTTYAPVNPYAARYLRGKEKEMFYLVDPQELLEKMILWQPLDDKTLERYNRTWDRAYK